MYKNKPKLPETGEIFFATTTLFFFPLTGFVAGFVSLGVQVFGDVLQTGLYLPLFVTRYVSRRKFSSSEFSTGAFAQSIFSPSSL